MPPPETGRGARAGNSTFQAPSHARPAQGARRHSGGETGVEALLSGMRKAAAKRPATRTEPDMGVALLSAAMDHASSYAHVRLLRRPLRSDESLFRQVQWTGALDSSVPGTDSISTRRRAASTPTA